MGSRVSVYGLGDLAALTGEVVATHGKARDYVLAVEGTWAQTKEPYKVLRSAETVHWAREAAFHDWGLGELGAQSGFRSSILAKVSSGSGQVATEVQRAIHESSANLSEGALRGASVAMNQSLGLVTDWVGSVFGGVRQAIGSSLQQSSGALAEVAQAAGVVTSALGAAAPIVGNLVGAVGGSLLTWFFAGLFGGTKPPPKKDLTYWEYDFEPSGFGNCFDSGFGMNRAGWYRRSEVIFGETMIVGRRFDLKCAGGCTGVKLTNLPNDGTCKPGARQPLFDEYLVRLRTGGPGWDAQDVEGLRYTNPGATPDRGWSQWLYGGWQVDQGPRLFPWYPWWMRESLEKWGVPAAVRELAYSLYKQARFQRQDKVYKQWVAWDNVLKPYVPTTTRAAASWIWWFLPLPNDWGLPDLGQRVTNSAYSVGGITANIYSLPDEPGMSTGTKAALGVGAAALAGAVIVAAVKRRG